MAEAIDFRGITAGRNLMVLVTAPLDVAQFCAQLIAEACLRGRPPFVVVLTDGSGGGTESAAADASAATQERRIRAIVRELGVPPEWFLMLGLHDGTAPLAGRKFDAVVAAISLIMWRRDCNTLVAPAPFDPRADYRACHAMAMAAAHASGVGFITYPTAPLSQATATARLLPRADAAERVVSAIGMLRTEYYSPIATRLVDATAR
jgi:LmbE family N-acetylglucosaminyl deacetylase